MPQISALTLDLDGVLWNVWPSIARAEARLHDWLGEHYPRVAQAHTPESLRAMNREAVRRNPQIAHDVTLIRKGGLDIAAKQQGYETFDTEAAYAVFMAERNIVEFFDGAFDLLEALSSRLPIVAVSNGNADIDRIGIGTYFHAATNPTRAGARKPDKRIFEHAARLHGAPLKAIVHIGDEWETDMAGALNAGMSAIWYNPTGQGIPVQTRRLHMVSRLDQIPAALDRLAGV